MAEELVEKNTKTTGDQGLKVKENVRKINAHQVEIDTVRESLFDEASKKTYDLILKARTMISSSLSQHCSEASFDDCIISGGFSEEAGYELLLTKNQYFYDDIFDFGPETVFLDGGAYIGDTVAAFCKHVKNQYDYIYAFELDPDNYRIMTRIVGENHPKIQLLNYGLDNQEGEILFSSTGGDSRISKKGKSTGYVVDAGKFLSSLEENFPTFIKLDIEGKEKDVIATMTDYIRSNKPDLAICIYHSLEDLWEIPLLIKEICPEYSLYIRHHQNYLWETVCYATVNDEKTPSIEGK